MAGIARQELETELPPYLTPEQVEEVIGAARSPRDKLLIRLLFRTGMRVTELLGVRGSDIQWGDRLILIRALKQRRAKEEVRRRLVPVDGETLELLKAHMSSRTKGLLFPITRQRVWQIVVEAGERAGIKWVVDLYKGKRHHLHPHTLRHSFGVHWVRRHGQQSLRELQLHMGHSNISTTAQYLQFSPQELHRQYDQLWEE
jgi:integrase